MSQGTVTVYGESALASPLLLSAAASTIVIRDCFDSPIFVFRRIGGDVWGMATPEDEDWSDQLLALGFPQDKPHTPFN